MFRVFGNPKCRSVIVLFCWLININDISGEIREAGSGLFIDDVALWLSSDNERVVVDELNAELFRIYSWSILNHMVFDFKKFHLISLGLPFSPESRDSLRFGEGTPGWSPDAKYLGLLVDEDGSFVPFLEHVFSRIQASSWRIFNHDDFVFGVSQKTLEMSFNAWLYPIIEYACPVWIFRIKDSFHYSSPVVDPYVSVFKRLETQYHQLAKAVLGVPRSTSNVATLVRLGWMPLDYRLAFRACIWYIGRYVLDLLVLL